MTKDLKFFMRSREKEIIKVPGPESFKDNNGNVIEFEIRTLTQNELDKIRDNYTKRSIALDGKKRPYITGNNEIAFKTERDNTKIGNHMIVEALVYPNLKDPELMKYYDCTDITEMPRLVFSKAEEYAHVDRMVSAAHGFGDFENNESENEIIEEAKN